MSRLHPTLLALDKGLDLQSPKLIAEQGTVSDTLNYEQVDFQGQKRIDGYTRYDGSPLSAIDEFAVYSAATTTTYGLYEVAFNDGRPWGVYVGLADGIKAFAVIDYTNIPENAVWGAELGSITPDQHYAYLLQFNTYLRERVEGLPGPIIGLHWFRDRLYAVADIESYEPDDTRIDTLSNASLFESRTVKQVLDEDGPSGPYDFGWKFVHQGWEVPFSEGRVLYGDLVAKNQNRSGIGIQGPTSIAGMNGTPMVLSQKVAITNDFAQVNGWKSSDTPTSFILNPDDVIEIDDEFAYADAFVFWNGESGVVSAPGSDGSGLVEYPANSAVTVEV